MKKLLLGTTALAGALVLGLATAPQASAQAVAASSPFSIRIQGYSNQSLVILSADADANTRSHDLYSDSEIHFTVTGKADNGLSYGFRAEFEVDRGNVQNASRTIDENSLFFQGSWGRVEIGQNDSPNALDSVLPGRTCYGFGDGCIGSDGPLAFIALTSKLRDAGNAASISAGNGHIIDTNDATKIIYSSPNFSGFNFNAAYTPTVRNADGSQPDGQRFSFSEAAGDRRDGIELGAGYQGKVGSVDLDVRLAYNYIKVEDVGAARFEDVNAFGGGIGIGIGGFRAGVVVGYNGKSLQAKNAANDDASWLVVVDADYVVGPWAVGVGFNYETGEGSTTAPGNETAYAIAGKVAYTLAPGLRILGELAYLNLEDKDLASNNRLRDVDSVVFTLGTQLRF